MKSRSSSMAPVILVPTSVSNMLTMQFDPPTRSTSPCDLCRWFECHLLILWSSYRRRCYLPLARFTIELFRDHRVYICKSVTMTLVIDTSRQTSRFSRTAVDRNDGQTPSTSSATPTTSWSTSTCNTTPSTGLTTVFNQDRFLCTHPSAASGASSSTSPHCLISTIDEYLADLRFDFPTAKASARPLRHRASLTLEVDATRRFSVEHALASSPDAMWGSHMATPPPLACGKTRTPDLPVLEHVDHSESVIASPDFYRCFKSHGRGMVIEDAAAFPYSPCRESVFVDTRRASSSSGFARSDQDACRRRTSMLEVSVDRESVEKDVERNDGREPLTSSPTKASLPSIRFQAAAETGYVVSYDSGAVDGSASTSLSESAGSSVTYFGHEEKRVTADDTTMFHRSEVSSASTDIIASETASASPPTSTASIQAQGPSPRPASLESVTSPASLPIHKPSRCHQPPLLVPPIRAERPGLSRSASAGNLSPTSRNPVSTKFAAAPISPRATRPHLIPVKRDPKTGAFTAVLDAKLTRTLTTSPPPTRPKTAETSPTSTEIVKGVRKMNKLKKLLGDEVGSHISNNSVGTGPSMTCPPRVLALDLRSDSGGVKNTMKPLPDLPPRRVLQRSNTMNVFSQPSSSIFALGSLKSRDKHGWLTATDSKRDRPSTGTDAARRAPRMTRTMPNDRPSTSASMQTRAYATDADFLER